MTERIESTPPQPASDESQEWSATTYSVNGDRLQDSMPHRSIWGGIVETVNIEVQSIAQNLDTPEQKRDEMSLVIDGTLGGLRVPMEDFARNATRVVSNRRWMARLVHRSPEVAKYMVEHHVGGFHMTASSTLPGLVESGRLMSGKQLIEEGRPVSHGRHDVAPGGQASISLGGLAVTKDNLAEFGAQTRNLTHEETIADFERRIARIKDTTNGMADSPLRARLNQAARILEGAQAVYTQNPQSLVARFTRDQFPVAIGISDELIQNFDKSQIDRLLAWGSEYDEFRLAVDSIPMESLPIIGVPRDRVAMVKRLFEDYDYPDVLVVALEILTGEI